MEWLIFLALCIISGILVDVSFDVYQIRKRLEEKDGKHTRSSDNKEL